MTFADAVVNLREGYAAKRQSWNGYVKKTNVNEDLGTYTLTFMKIGMQGSYTYVFNGEHFGPCDTMFHLDEQLLDGLIADDWITGKVEDFESVRSPSEDKVW